MLQMRGSGFCNTLAKRQFILHANAAAQREVLRVARFETFCGTEAAVGIPNIGLQGFAPKVLAHGHHGQGR